MSRTTFKVTYANRVARFSSRTDAHEWARYISGMSGHFVEVSDKTGLIGQYDDGKPTPEFKGYNYCLPEPDDPNDDGLGGVYYHKGKSYA